MTILSTPMNNIYALYKKWTQIEFMQKEFIPTFQKYSVEFCLTPIQHFFLSIICQQLALRSPRTAPRLRRRGPSLHVAPPDRTMGPDPRPLGCGHRIRVLVAYRPGRPHRRGVLLSPFSNIRPPLSIKPPHNIKPPLGPNIKPGVYSFGGGGKCIGAGGGGGEFSPVSAQSGSFLPSWLKWRIPNISPAFRKQHLSGLFNS